MAHTPPGADVHQPLDILGYFAPKVTFNFIIGFLNNAGYVQDLCFRQVLRALIRTDPCFFKDLIRLGPADTE